jgi:undecaprenyl-diphosphatase
VCLTRVYTGFHYPSDIAAGALIAILVVAAGAKLRVGQRIEPMMARLERRAPALFAGAAFIVLFQVVTMFNDARALARSAASVLPGGA